MKSSKICEDFCLFVILIVCFLFCFCCFILEIEPRPFHMLGTYYITKQYHQIYQTSIKMGFADGLGASEAGSRREEWGWRKRVQGEMAGIRSHLGGVIET